MTVIAGGSLLGRGPAGLVTGHKTEISKRVVGSSGIKACSRSDARPGLARRPGPSTSCRCQGSDGDSRPSSSSQQGPWASSGAGGPGLAAAALAAAITMGGALLPPLGDTLSSSHLLLTPQAVQAAEQWGQQQQRSGYGALQQAGGSAEEVLEVASEVEDKLLEVVRQVEARVDSAVGALGSQIPGASTPSLSPEEQLAVNEQAQMLIQEVWEVVDQNYLDARATGWDRALWGTLRDQALARTYSDIPSAYRAIKEMMARGVSDPYCRFIAPSELAAMKKYDVTGVGLNLGTGEEYERKTGKSLPLQREATNSGVFVVGLSKGSPADRAGLRQGDEIVEVDGTSVTSQSPFQTASLIAGVGQEQQQQAAASGDSNQGSVEVTPRPYVELKVRKADGMTQVLTVDRPVRTLPSPVTASLQKSVTGGGPTGVLRLTSFNARAQRDLAAAVSNLEAQGAQSLVLDLRDNRGGLVSEGLEVARLFLEDNAPLVITEGRATFSEPPRAQGPALTRLPLVVLVNEHTASASEIVAGALHDNCRAVLVGSRTYGKGLIQSVYELSDGSGMVLTVGKYLTPNRTDIDRSGIQPDFRSQPSPRIAQQTVNACALAKNGVALLQQRS